MIAAARPAWTVESMSNRLSVLLPVWMGPSTSARLVEQLLGGAAAGVSCRPTPDPVHAQLGCSFDVVIPGARDIRRFYFHVDGDHRGRRLITTTDCVFWRLTFGALLRHVLPDSP